MHNICLLTDSYKASHWKQYPPGTTNIYSYFESRGGEFKHTVFFGLQYLLKEYLNGPVVNYDKIDEAYEFYKAHFGQDQFNMDGWTKIVHKHGGFLPIRIRAVPEGSVVPTSNVLITIENTDPECFWLTNYLETLLVQVWYPTTVATQSWYMKQILLSYLDKTGDPSLVDFKLHDFGFRGVSSVETAGIGGMAHLVNFKGTDTVEGIRYADRYYNSGVCGFSIPASEHSTITSWGRENEVKAFRNMLKQYPTGLVACVSDSFNIYDACEKLWGEDLSLEVRQREGTLVIRPDSGDPLVVIPKVLQILGEKFGVSRNEKGFKVLNPKVRVIQGDGIDRRSMHNILDHLYMFGWSTDNIAFGSGGGLLQKLNRDTCKFAFKASSITYINGETTDSIERNIYKEPITDGGKKSKSGRLGLVKVVGPNGFTFKTVKESYFNDIYTHNELVEVFKNGTITKEYDWIDIKRRVEESGKAVKAFEGL